jgi:hypothetical protein
MSGLGFERATLERVQRLFQEKLGYRYLGNWKDRPGNRRRRLRLDPRLPLQAGLHGAREHGAAIQAATARVAEKAKAQQRIRISSGGC